MPNASTLTPAPAADTAELILEHIRSLLPSTDTRPRPWRAGPADRASGFRCLTREEAEQVAEQGNADRAAIIAAGGPRWIVEYTG